MTPKLNRDSQSNAPLGSLVPVIESRLSRTGDYDTSIANLTFFRRDSVGPPAVCMVEPCIVLVAQGVKHLWVGGAPYRYDTSRFLITSLDLPANSEVVEASPGAPCVGLTLKLDLRVLAELIAHSSLPPTRGKSVGTGVGIGTVTPDLLSPLSRLVDLLDDLEAIPVLAPLIQREIHYRLLRSDQAAWLRKIVSVDSHGHRIAKAIDWLKLNYAAPLRVDDLAARVQMSPPTFHQHFRHLTGMSPLQYQKWLRLNEARRLMLNEQLDAGSAAFKVGYESPSQFSREYSRLFGSPPKRDIAVLRGSNNGAETLTPSGGRSK